MLQIALVLLGSALSFYLWSMNRPVAGIAMTVTLFGFEVYTFLTITVTFFYYCPHQSWTADSLSSTLTILDYIRVAVKKLLRRSDSSTDSQFALRNRGNQDVDCSLILCCLRSNEFCFLFVDVAIDFCGFEG